MVPTLGQANRWISAQPSYTRPAEESYCFRRICGSFPVICFASCDFCEVLIDPSSLNSEGATALFRTRIYHGSGGPLVLAMPSSQWYSCAGEIRTSSPSTLIGFLMMDNVWAWSFFLIVTKSSESFPVSLSGNIGTNVQGIIDIETNINHKSHRYVPRLCWINLAWRGYVNAEIPGTFASHRGSLCDCLDTTLGTDLIKYHLHFLSASWALHCTRLQCELWATILSVPTPCVWYWRVHRAFSQIARGTVRNLYLSMFHSMTDSRFRELWIHPPLTVYLNKHTCLGSPGDIVYNTLRSSCGQLQQSRATYPVWLWDEDTSFM